MEAKFTLTDVSFVKYSDLVQVLYLLRLCAYENEQTVHFISSRNNYALIAQEKKGGIWSQDLIITKAQKAAG